MGLWVHEVMGSWTDRFGDHRPGDSLPATLERGNGFRHSMNP
jgi:hypothetical protein